ncbi:TlpA family protein disulfide reductase [Plebeiibacterium marinum]|uniref:DUF4369 domain-containing protein n=1 Tax=Plebeiibacterium marinum TaxID=2992111 RepID=A0AAE3MI41_9BACT|nr:DUF4369 domain-containing protein [Plebeiobacterium marinum]MCW3807886.1 DUF4369 domain-containing protein [Plebeiobacterium marinum]
MRYIIVYMLLIGLFACNKPVEQKVPVVDGQVINANGGKLFFYQQNTDIKLLDTITVSDQGSFRIYKESVTAPGFYFLQFENGQRINLFLRPADFIQLQVDANDVINSCKSKNSKTMNALWEIDRNTKELKTHLDRISGDFAGIVGKDSAVVLYQSLVAQKDSLLKKYKSKALKLLKGIDDEVVKWYTLNQKVANIILFSLEEDLKLFLGNSEKLMKDDRLSELFYDYDQDLMKAYSFIRRTERYSKGEQMIELKARTNWDEMLPLDKLNAKLILLVLWNGDVEACEVRLKEIESNRKKYGHRGLKVLMVAYENNKESWKENISRLSSSYWNIVDTTGIESTDLVELGVRSLPFNFLVSPEGTIVERELWGAELETGVENFLKNY